MKKKNPPEVIEVIGKLANFAREVAATGYDGKPCTHDRNDCEVDAGGYDCCEVDAGGCLATWDMSNDETHDTLVRLVQEAQSLVALLPPSGGTG